MSNVNCKNCLKIFVPTTCDQIFCSTKCYGVNKSTSKKFCISCNKKLHSANISGFCKGCFVKNTDNKNRILFLNGNLKHYPTIKKFLVEDFGYKCSICQINKWCNKPLCLIMDHIDGNSDNNKPENLRLVCSNCDSQLPTYKSKNKGNGRNSRRIKYKLNKKAED